MAEKRSITELDLIDNFLFQETMGDEENGALAARLILSVIMGHPVEHVYVQTEKVLTSGDPNLHGIRMDVYVRESSTENGFENVYDVEMESGKRGDLEQLPRRSRYYQALIDSKLLQTSAPYQDLNPLWVILITPKDLFGRDRMCYTFENRCVEEPDLSLNDGARRIFLYTKGKKGSRKNLELLLRYITDSRKENVLDDTTKQLHEIVEKVRYHAKMGAGYMSLAYEIEWEKQEARKEGLELGRTQGRMEGRRETQKEERLDFARKLLKHNRPIEEIMEYTGLDRESIENLLLQPAGIIKADS